jgi:formamidopyrimidine-DNA glycosylase
MPELPEVEVLVRHLAPLLRNKIVRRVEVRRDKVLQPTLTRTFKRQLLGAQFNNLRRRGKYLLFDLRAADSKIQPSESHTYLGKKPNRPHLAKRHPLHQWGRGQGEGVAGEKAIFTLVGHLGLTGRMYLVPSSAALPKHAAVVLNLGDENFVFEDTRYFGRLTLDERPIEKLGPEPLEKDFTIERFRDALKRSSQAIKIRLLDQRLVAGIGNIYASEALFRAGISPRVAARRLNTKQIVRLWRGIRDVLAEAIECGSTVTLNYAGSEKRDGLFYFGRAAGAPDYYEERLRVYDRAQKPCPDCGTAIKRLIQAARSTFYCPRCQRS